MTEEKRAYNRAYYAANKKTLREKQSVYYSKNADKVRARQSEWHADNPNSRKQNDLKHNYGIGLDRFNVMLSEQGGACAICGTTTPKGRGNTFHVDHCHTTGRVRSLLCSLCNVGLGHFNDNPERLMKAASYIKQHQQEAA